MFHRFLAGGFCGVEAPAGAVGFALAAWGRFDAVARAGAAGCRGRLSRGAASAAVSPRSRFRVVVGPAAEGVRPRALPAACSPPAVASADDAARLAPTTAPRGRLAPAPPRTAVTVFHAYEIMHLCYFTSAVCAKQTLQDEKYEYTHMK